MPLEEAWHPGVSRIAYIENGILAAGLLALAQDPDLVAGLGVGGAFADGFGENIQQEGELVVGNDFFSQHLFQIGLYRLLGKLFGFAPLILGEQVAEGVEHLADPLGHSVEVFGVADRYPDPGRDVKAFSSGEILFFKEGFLEHPKGHVRIAVFPDGFHIRQIGVADAVDFYVGVALLIVRNKNPMAVPVLFFYIIPVLLQESPFDLTGDADVVFREHGPGLYDQHRKGILGVQVPGKEHQAGFGAVFHLVFAEKVFEGLRSDEQVPALFGIIDGKQFPEHFPELVLPHLRDPVQGTDILQIASEIVDVGDALNGRVPGAAADLLNVIG